MRETERQIQAYRAKLPRMRERVMAALTMLIVSAVMMVSTSYAWVVLSVNPEIKGINTTITANGNLEIALATGTTITPPAEAAIGDSGKDLVLKNATWGNLINLADPAYGLEEIVLRPAKLNTNSLLESPLYSAGYGADGRVDELESDFAFASWDTGTKEFLAQNVQYGVRTIASVVYQDAGGDAALAALETSARLKRIAAQEDLQRIAEADQIDDLGMLMQQYVQEMVNQKIGSAEKVIKIDPQNLRAIYEMMGMLHDNMEKIADALAEAYNIQMLRNKGSSYYAENKFTATELLTASTAALDAKMQSVVTPYKKSWLTTLRNQYNNLGADIAELALYLDRTDVVWENLSTTPEDQKKPEIYPIVNRVVHISTATIDGTPLSNLSKDAVLDLLDKKNVSVEAKSGYLKDADQLSGARIASKDIKLTISVLIFSKSVNGTVTTFASNAKNTEPYALATEYNTALSGATNYKGTDPVAEDTFGLALDFFLRTNAPSAKLVLQGSPVYSERQETVTGQLGDKTVSLYTVTVGTGNNAAQYTAYLNAEDNQYYIYNEDTKTSGSVIENPTNAVLKTETVKYVTGYTGVNRVWDTDGNAYLDGSSTTQGAGSCYVFYSSSPEDQEKSLQLLDHMRVAFVDQRGNLLTTAYMDTQNKFEQTGKVTVPLALSSTSESITGPDGEPIYTITDLQPNEATFITALVYLDGVGLTNDQVLAAGEIQGQLNIQFGTTTDLLAMEDPVLMEEKCQVSATMDGDTAVSFDTATEAEMKKRVTVTVTGYEPAKVEAYFLREINAMQGVRQGKMTFTKGADGKWTAEHQFTAPGKYILREVMLDGIMYELTSPITFTVDGFTITGVLCDDNQKVFMTADKQHITEVSITFASSDESKMPTSVKGAFIHKETGNRTTVYFTRSAGSTWKGSAVFTTSGEYRMEYVELNDQYTGLAESQHVSMTLYLGLSTRVYASGQTTFGLEEGQSRDVDMSVAIESDDGTRIPDLTDVSLSYANAGSGLTDNTLYASLRWNASRMYYEGTFHIDQPGIYNFSYVGIGTAGSLTNAITAPTITAISYNPPYYVSKDGFGEVFSLGSDAAFSITMSNAGSATIDAELKNEAGDIYYSRGVQSIVDGKQVFTFTIPVVEGSQAGTWTLQGVYMTNVTGGGNGEIYNAPIADGPDTATEAKPMYTVADGYYRRWWRWSVEDLTAEGETTDPTVAVIGSLDIRLDATGTTTAYSGTFGQTHKLDGFNMSVSVSGGQSTSLSDYGLTVNSIKVVYGYDEKSVTTTNNGETVVNSYGNYTIAKTDWTNVLGNSDTTVEFTYTAQEGAAPALYALTTTHAGVPLPGQYKVKSIAVTVAKGDKTIEEKIDANTTNASLSAAFAAAPTYTVRSTKPAVKFTAVTPAVGEEFDAINDAGDGKMTVSNRIVNDQEIVVYYKALSGSDGCSSLCLGFTAPQATVELSNAGNYKSATCTVVSKVAAANNGASNVTFSFTPTANGNPNTQTIGQNVGQNENPKYIGERATATQIVLVGQDNYSYTFDLDPSGYLYVTCIK